MKRENKLRLSRETLRRLKPVDLGQVIGGVSPGRVSGSDTPEYHCNSEGFTCATCLVPSYCMVCDYQQPQTPPPGPIIKNR
jgi:hypothetical protein